MKVIEPTKREVFQALRMDGCTWCGGRGCECHMKINMCGCFESKKKWLTKIEYTNEEIEKTKSLPNEAEEAFDEFWEYVNS